MVAIKAETIRRCPDGACTSRLRMKCTRQRCQDVPVSNAPATRRTAWFHCFAGTSGDMTMASLVHAGADPAAVADILGGLPLDPDVRAVLSGAPDVFIDDEELQKLWPGEARYYLVIEKPSVRL